MLLDEYVKYPYGTAAVFPFNYCLAKQVAPKWLHPAFDLVC